MNHPVIAVTKDALTAFLARGGDMQAGYIAYALLLAIFPFLIFCVSLTGWLIGDARSSQAIAVLFDFAPKYLAEVLEPVLVEVLAHDHGLFTIFIVLAIWAAMRAVEAINRAFDGIYGERDGGVWMLRKTKALVTVIVSAIAAVVLGLSILLAPALINLIEEFTKIDIPTNINLMRYVVGTIVFYCLMWILHWFLPNHHAQGFPRWQKGCGSAFGTGVQFPGMGPTTHFGKGKWDHDSQSEQQQQKLYDIGEGHRPQAAHGGIGYGNGCRKQYRCLKPEAQHGAESGAQSGQNRRGPKDFAGKRWQKCQGCHAFTETLPQWIEHGPKLVSAHGTGKQQATDDQAQGISPWGLHPDEAEAGEPGVGGGDQGAESGRGG